MGKVGNPKLTEASNEDFTKITFQPDLKKFKMNSLDRDIVDLMARRAYDIAASTGGVKVYLNDKRIPVR
jgi:DNA topoisomerase II